MAAVVVIGILVIFLFLQKSKREYYNILFGTKQKDSHGIHNFYKEIEKLQ